MPKPEKTKSIIGRVEEEKKKKKKKKKKEYKSRVLYVWSWY